MFRKFSFLFQCAAIFLLWPTLALSNQTVTISDLISKGYVQQARAAMMSTNPSEADQVFFAGQVLKSQRKLKEAIDVFRQVLRIDPNYINARRELAHSLFLNRNYAAAEFHFTALMKLDQNPTVRAGYMNFLRMIDAHQPWRLSGYFAIKPSTNINSGTTANELETLIGNFKINEESKAKSGVGVEFGLSAAATKAFSATSEVSAKLTGNRSRYTEALFNTDYARLESKYRHQMRNGHWSFGIFGDRTWSGGSLYNKSTGAQADVTWNLGHKNALSISVSRQLVRYPVLEYKDGPINRYTFKYAQEVSNALGWYGGVGFEEAKPRNPSNQYSGTRFFGGVNKLWQGGMITGFGFELGQREYAANYPLTLSARADHYRKISVNVYHSKFQLWGFAPKLSCSFTDQKSNVAFFDFQSTSCTISLSQNF